MKSTNSAIRIGIGMLRFMAEVESIGRSIETKIEASVPVAGASRLRTSTIEENLTNLCSAMETAVKIQSAICSADAVALDRILGGGHEVVCSAMSIKNLEDNDSAAGALKALRTIGQQTNSNMLNHMEALFRSLGSDGDWIKGNRTTSIAAKLHELGDTIGREMALISYLIADLSDPSVAM